MNYSIRQTNQCTTQKYRGANFLAPFGLAALVFLLFAACTEPAPIYGTWADNHGDSLSFFDDGTFSATLVDADKEMLYFD
jgi:hypothetical protein